MIRDCVAKIKLFEDGKIPFYATIDASCADCYANEKKFVWLKPVLISLGFALEIESGYEAQIRPRSGMSKRGHFVSLGTIDADYRGEVKACMWSLLPYKVKKGDRVCQIYLGESKGYGFQQVDKLSETERGSGGFGHTGK